MHQIVKIEDYVLRHSEVIIMTLQTISQEMYLGVLHLTLEKRYKKIIAFFCIFALLWKIYKIGIFWFTFKKRDLKNTRKFDVYF
jgi:hypothetical protein